MLNILLAGNLPPFGCVCVIVEDKNNYLVIQRPEGGFVFPGGFMRWRESPVQTIEREGREETGMHLQVKELIGCSSTSSENFSRMSTLTVIYQAEVVGGELKSSIEGHPSWQDGRDLLNRLQKQQRGILEHFLRYREQREQLKRFQI